MADIARMAVSLVANTSGFTKGLGTALGAVKTFAGGALSGIGRFASGAMGFLAKFGLSIEGIKKVLQGFKFVSENLPRELFNAGQVQAADDLQAAINGIKSAWESVSSAILSVAGPAISMISQAILDVIDYLSPVADSFTSFFSDVFTVVGEFAAGAIRFLGASLAFLAPVLELVGKLFKWLWGIVKGVFGFLFDVGMSVTISLAKALESLFRLLAKLPGRTGAFFSSAADTAQKALERIQAFQERVNSTSSRSNAGTFPRSPQQGEARFSSALSRGSAEAVSAINAFRQGREREGQELQTISRNTEQTNRLLGRINRSVERSGSEVLDF